jgi:hypothetical protein
MRSLYSPIQIRQVLCFGWVNITNTNEHPESKHRYLGTRVLASPRESRLGIVVT